MVVGWSFIFVYNVLTVHGYVMEVPTRSRVKVCGFVSGLPTGSEVKTPCYDCANSHNRVGSDIPSSRVRHIKQIVTRNCFIEKG